jgi:hypothetical protein
MATDKASSFCLARDALAMARADVDALGASYANVEADFYVDIQFKALDALMLAPAPDLPALIYKLELFAAEECFDYSRQFRDPIFAALIADVRRLEQESAA